MKLIFNIFVFLIGCLIGFKSNAQQYKWSKVLTSNDGFDIKSHTVDPSGNSYVVAMFYSFNNDPVDIDPGPAVVNVLSSNGIFLLMKFDINGNLTWYKQAMPMGTNMIYDPIVRFDPLTSNIVIVGNLGVNETDVDLSSTVHIINSFTGGDIVIARYSSANGNFVQAKRIVTSSNFQNTNWIYVGTVRRGPLLLTNRNPVEIDNAGNITIIGYFDGRANFEINNPVPSSIWNKDAGTLSFPFVVRYNNSGAITYFEMANNGWAESFAIAKDNSGNSIVLGRSSNEIYNTGITTTMFNNSIYIRKLGSSSTTPLWTKEILLGDVLLSDVNVIGSLADNIAVDAADNIYISGYFRNTVDFNPGPGVFNLSSPGALNSFVAKYDANGNFIWAKKIGLADIWGLKVTASNKLAFYGNYDNEDLDFGINTTIADGVMLSVHDTAGNLLTHRAMHENIGYYGMNVHANNLYIYGMFETETDFDLATPLGYHESDTPLNSGGIPHATFLVKYNDCAPNNTILTDSICAGSTYSFNNQNLNTAGVYHFSVPSATASCDSTIILQLSTYSISSAVTASICPGQTYVFNNQNLTTPGTYTAVFQSAAGCDSTVTLTLNIPTINTTVTQTNNVLNVAVNNASSYQWIDCSNNAVINGANAQTFEPAVSGTYKVTVVVNGCTVSSDCINFTKPSSINDHINHSVASLYPNPAKSEIQVNLTDKNVYNNLQLADLSGRILRTINIIGKQQSVIDVSHLTPGVYLLKFIGNSSSHTIKFVKQ